jgi:hypothetical protein
LVAISGSFTDKNSWAGGIRRAQAEAAFLDPDGRLDISIGDGATLTLVTKRVERPRPHVMILVASASGGSPTALTSGYRIYGSESEVDALKSEPRAALAELIRRFGREISINGGAPTMYIEALFIDATDLNINAGDGDFTVTSFVRRRAGGGFDLSYVWAIDEVRYRAALASN